MLEYYPLPVSIKCREGKAPNLFRVAITVDSNKVVHNVIIAGDLNQPLTTTSGNLSEALQGEGYWVFQFFTDIDEFCYPSSHPTALQIDVGDGMIAVRSKVTSQFPINPRLERNLLGIVAMCDDVISTCTSDYYDDSDDS